MDENLSKLNEAIKYAEDEREKFSSLLDDERKSLAVVSPDDQSSKDLHNENIDGLQKRIDYLDEEIGKMQDTKAEIEEYTGSLEGANLEEAPVEEESQEMGR